MLDGQCVVRLSSSLLYRLSADEAWVFSILPTAAMPVVNGALTVFPCATDLSGRGYGNKVCLSWSASPFAFG